MRLALGLAERGLESVSPNPMVGAVLVRRARILGKGYHRRYGGPHAEVEALAGTKNPRGADLYVTLEPCGHHGKTPPCAEAIVAAGVKRVFYAVRDPNPLTRGRGLKTLRRGGVAVIGGLLQEEAAALNAPFFHWMRTGLPWVLLKWAMTLDGKIATARGESKWITGEAARLHSQRLRRRVDAVLVGTETLLADDPLLTPRPARGRYPVRILLDRRGRLPLRLRLLASGSVAGPGERIYVTSRSTSQRRLRLLESRGLQLLTVPVKRQGFQLEVLLRKLGELGISQILVEGGAALAGSCLAGGFVQEVAAYVAPRILGGEEARGAVGGAGLDLLDTRWLREPAVRRVGQDILIQGRVRSRE